MKNSANNLPILPFTTPSAWETWLQEHHTETNGLWLKIAKKGAPDSTISYAEALEIALCYGWIDGQKSALDQHYWLQKFTPRRPKSIWSQVNCAKVEVLIAEGRMQPAGLRQIELAKADGRWEQAYASQSTIDIPADFQSELDKNPQARDFFHTLNSSNRYSFLFRIHTTKKAEARAARIQKFIEMLSKHEKFHP